MEWWKLFSGTFILIFLAELGDKTQLAAMAKTADSPDNSSAKWIVFFGASAALVASTFIAVFLGHLLKTVVPDERYIKIAAGSLFLVFGAMIMYETYSSFRGERAAPAPAAAAEAAEPGLVGNLALSAAMDFESATAERYRRLAGRASPALAALLASLAREEDSHLARLRGLPEPVRDDTDHGSFPATDISTREGTAAVDSPDTLAELIRHEEATAEFYHALARRALIPSLKSIFGRLAEEEQGHAARLTAMAERERERRNA